MSQNTKNQREILAKLGIERLNEMQEEAKLAISSHPNTILLSPTGTGKTLAFLLPIINELDADDDNVQAIILAPSRELAIQIAQVTREMGAGFKVNEVYGGRNFSKDKVDLKHNPAILVGTPGRIADHLRRATFDTNTIKTLVLDEFDKSLEVGFEEEMKEIISLLPNIEKRVLTSATKDMEIPAFVGMHKPLTINYLGEKIAKLTVKRILSPAKDKLDTLLNTISHMANQPGIIFCNFKNTIQYVSDFLHENNIPHGCFYGGMEQKDRERALIKFRNGTHQLIIATDLAARGIDVPEIKYIIHYQLPLKAQEFTHRNGRTARMHAEGTAFVLQWKEESVPDFIAEVDVIEEMVSTKRPTPSDWKTLFISGGRKDKISKGDIAGLFIKQGKLNKDELGMIELKQDCAFVAVKASKVKEVIQKVDNTRLKKKKVRVSRI
ncbi:superfamily II DNA/RNA helicase [Kordia periserrulae]|uniref:Superfamily II DNA/RNA helicase n=1 Tax=Kordia periserrulae TaxID=701523 RepID=A0A2T6C008_9FLAO|nr:DEAD/DEAH box helicase [Kordia periserrulae]PTX61659.1 superfamily II DNA/RNA helicase [Kordia periserrulae]